MRQLPHLDKVQRKFKERGLVVLAVAVQDERAKVETLAKKQPWALQFAIDTDLKAARAYRFDSLPHGFLIDTQGVLRAIHTGEEKEEELAQKLEKEILPLLPRRLKGRG